MWTGKDKNLAMLYRLTTIFLLVIGFVSGPLGVGWLIKQVIGDLISAQPRPGDWEFLASFVLIIIGVISFSKGSELLSQDPLWKEAKKKILDWLVLPGLFLVAVICIFGGTVFSLIISLPWISLRKAHGQPIEGLSLIPPIAFVIGLISFALLNLSEKARRWLEEPIHH